MISKCLSAGYDMTGTMIRMLKTINVATTCGSAINAPSGSAVLES